MTDVTISADDLQALLRAYIETANFCGLADLCSSLDCDRRARIVAALDAATKSPSATETPVQPEVGSTG